MPVNFEIFPRRGFVIARFSGHVLLADCLSSAQAYSEHPDFHPSQRQLVDFSSVTSYERDVVRMLEMMAKLPEHLVKPGFEPLVIHLAPHDLAMELANFTRRSVEGMESVNFRIVTSEAEALDILGQRERRLSDLYTDPAKQ